MFSRIKKAGPLACFLLLLFIPQISFAQKKQKALITGMFNIYLGLDPVVEKKQVKDSLNKWFGKAKAAQITENVNVNNWPYFMIAVLSSYDTAVIGEYGRKLHCWKIATIEKNNILLEVRPEDNQHLGQADFKKPFYVFLENNEEVVIVKDWNGPSGSKTEPETNNTEVKKQNNSKYTNENFNNDAAMRKRRSVLEDYADKIQRLATEARTDGEKWELNRQIDQYNKIVSITMKMADDIDKTPFEYSSGNPRRSHYEALFASIKTAITDISNRSNELEKRLKEAKESGKKLSPYTLYTALDDLVRITRKATKIGLE
jgi:hypothetical protein